MWGTNAGGGALQHDTNPPSLAQPAAPGALLNRSCLTHPVPPGKEDGRSCKKVTIRMTIRKNECRSNTPVRGPGETVGVGWGGGEPNTGMEGALRGRKPHSLPHWPAYLQVNLVSCDGRCPSASIYNYNINTYARFCKCCREVGLQRRSVQLFCATNATWVPYTLQEPTDCACQWS